MKFLSKPCQAERKDAASSQMMATSNPPGLRYLGPADLGNLGGRWIWLKILNVPLLVGGFKYFLFSPLVGEMIQID